MAFEPNDQLQIPIEVFGQQFNIGDLPKTWNEDLKDDYAAKGNGVLTQTQALNATRDELYRTQLQVEENTDNIATNTSEINRLNTRINGIQSNIASLQSRVQDLEQSPYGSINRTVVAAINVPSGTPTKATFDNTNPSRRVSLGDEITIEDSGAYLTTGRVIFDAAQPFTVNVIAGTTTIASYNGSSIDEIIPAIVLPLLGASEIRVELVQTTGGALSINQGLSYLSTTRQGL